jgi:uncharacterized phage protein (TIGR02218 family)
MVTLRTYSVGGKTAVNIVSSTNASPVVVNVGSGHGFLAGEPVNISTAHDNVGARGDWRIRSVTATTITLEHPRTGANVAGTGVGTATGTAGRKYATLQLAESDTDNNLTAAGTDEQIDLELCMDVASDYSLGSGVAAHTFAGATTDSSHYRHIKAAPGHRFSPVDLSGVIVRKTQSAGAGGALVISENYCRVTGIGFTVLENGVTTGTHYGIDVSGTNATLDSVWMKYEAGTGSSAATCFNITGAGSYFFNCIAAGANSSTAGAFAGFVTNSGAYTFYNCAAFGLLNTVSDAYGFSVGNGAALRNCIALSCYNGVGASEDFDFGALTSASYCISSDASATTTPATSGYSGQSASSVWKYAEADDFRNRTTSVGVGKGTSLAATFQRDFAGTIRGIYWDIGPYAGTVAIDTSPPTDVISSVGSAGGRDYATIGAWITATSLHLISLNQRHIAEVYDDSDFSLGGTAASVTGATTDFRCYRMIRPATGQRYDPVTDTGVWITATATQTITVAEDYFSIEGVGIGNTGAGASRVNLEFKGRGNLADGVYAESTASTGSADAACFYGRLKSGQQWRNCIAVGGGAGTAGANYGFRATAATAGIYNCVAADIDGAGGTSYGFHTALADARVINCIGSGCDADFGSTVDPVEDYNISTDTTAAGAHSLISQLASAIFVNQATADFRLLDNDSPANNAGYALNLYFSTDFAGEDRASPWEIGAYTGAASAPLMPMHTIGDCTAQATLWHIERLDGFSIGFTDHNRALDHTGIAYNPGNGFDQSNKRAVSALRTSNVETRGSVTSDAITFEDLWARKYDGAKVTERLIDWRFPWATPAVTNVYYIESVRWTGEEWVANLASQPSRFGQEVGTLMSRDCLHQLGDAKCAYDVRLQSQYGQIVTSVPTDRAVLRASALSSETDEHFRFGRVEWLTGDNAGLVSEVLRYTDTGRELELQEPTPFTIQVGDTFNAIVGCSALFDDCLTKFNNLANFGGDPYMPGADRMIESPSR